MSRRAPILEAGLVGLEPRLVQVAARKREIIEPAELLHLDHLVRGRERSLVERARRKACNGDRRHLAPAGDPSRSLDAACQVNWAVSGWAFGSALSVRGAGLALAGERAGPHYSHRPGGPPGGSIAAHAGGGPATVAARAPAARAAGALLESF